jgi:hypothetical protein
VADFDGDEVPDEARLLVKEGGVRVALFAQVSTDTAAGPLMLNEPESLSALGYMGIELAPPGEYETACGKGYWECEPGEPPMLVLKHAGMNYFANEGGNSFFFWDFDSRSFKRIWISD